MSHNCDNCFKFFGKPLVGPNHLVGPNMLEYTLIPTFLSGGRACFIMAHSDKGLKSGLTRTRFSEQSFDQYHYESGGMEGGGDAGDAWDGWQR